MKRFALPLAAVVMAACQDAAAPPSLQSPSVPGSVSAAASVPIPGRYIVVLKPEVRDVRGVAIALTAAHGGKYDFLYASALKGFAGAIPDAAAAAIARDPRVSYVEADQTMHAITVQPNATWGLDRIDQRDLPLSTTYVYLATGAGVHAYIIDTGINATHDEFTGRVLGGRDEIDNDADPADCNGHGTHVAGTVGGTTYGVAKNVKLHGVRVLDCGGSGTNSGVIAGVDWVTANKVMPAVANMSLGGGFSQALNDAVSNSMASGVSYGLAAGNGYANACDGSPASTPDPAITVGATDINDNEASFSDRGACVDIWGPGVNITSAWIGSNTATDIISGTSMATPHVVGVAALYREAHNDWTPAQVLAAMKADATPDKVKPNNPFGLKPPFEPGQNKLLYMGLIVAAPQPPPLPPAAPTDLVATAAGQSQINLTWTDNADNEDGFKIERCTGSGCTSFTQIATAGANATSYSNTGLSASTTYNYRVRAHNAGGDSPFSNTSEATTDAPPPPPPAPAAPTALTATPAGQTQINLAWTDNADNESGFKIERCQGAGCGDVPSNFGQIATVGANVTTYSNTGLSSGTSYSYRVRANNTGGDSDYSNIATATTASPPPDLPPVARYTWSCTSKGGRQCSFNGTSSTDDKGITSYSWNFGDGTTGTGATVNHRYSSNGTRNVTLTVTDNATPTQQTGQRTCPVGTGTTGTCAP